MTRALGRYELLRPLARGGMAEVFLARRRAAGVEKLLVVKRIHPQRVGDARFLELFVREARLSMSLAHQNIVPVFDFGRSGDQVFLAMERVEGKDLGSSLARATRLLPPLVAAFVAAECCQALEYAHHRKAPDGTPLGIVHRDVTPRNVLLSWSGEVKLTDFGIAAVAGDSTSKLAGTPAYMAPEQARGEPLDARADVYAIGMVLREALTGCRARPGADRDALVANARTGELEAWPTTVAIPDDLRGIVDRATAAAAGDRFPDAQAMLAELDTFIVGDRATIKGSSPARQLATWLDVTWVGERRDEPDGEPEGGAELLSILDDLEAIGTGTERSMLATAADEPAPAPPPPAPRLEPTPELAPVPSRRRFVWLAVAAVLAVGVVAWRLAPRDPAVPVTPVAPLIAAPPTPTIVDAAVAVATSPDAADRAEPPDAAVAVRVAPRPDAGVAKREQVDAAPVVVARRRVTINALPWANFTIDSEPTVHQTIDTVELSVGRHTIHFSNTQLGVERDGVIEVPADHDITYVQNLRNP